ncbi:MAG: hypothetical protein FJ288_13490 [Planctomycetes bacterium]|nr:hypothetical protein [Planctomycetota bacterium]
MVKVKQWTFRIDGLAPTDVEVAEYINRLTQDPLFRDVDLVFSEEFPYKEGVMMRKFQLSLRLGLDAEKVLGPTGDGGAAPTPIATAAPAISHRHEGMPAAGQAHAFASESTPPAAPPAPAHPGRDEIPVLPARAERPAGEAGMPVLYPGLHAPAAKGDS